MKGLKVLSILIIFAVGCGETAKVKTKNVLPSGTIEGTVRDITTNEKLAGAEVYLYLNGEKISTITDVNGFFVISDIPAGSTYTVYASHPNYATALADVTLPDITSFPQGNARREVNFALYPLKGTLSIKVEWFPQGATQPLPATSAVIIIDLREIGIDMVLKGEADENGNYTFNNLPADYDGLEIPVYIYYIYDENEKPLKRDLNVFVYPDATVEKDVSLFAPGTNPRPIVVGAEIYPPGETADNRGNVNPKDFYLVVCYNMEMDTTRAPQFQNITSDVNVRGGWWVTNKCYAFSLQVDPDTDGRGDYRIWDGRGINGERQIPYNGTLN